MLLKSGNTGGYDRTVMWVGWGKTRTLRMLVQKHSEHPTKEQSVNRMIAL
jgi:hypothetical protein